MLRSCTLSQSWSEVLDCCLRTTRMHRSVYSFSFHGKFSISHRFLEAWSILTLVMANMSSTTHVWISWGYVCTIGGFEESLLVDSDKNSSIMSLESGRISAQLAHLEGKRLLVDIQSTLLPCARDVEAWGLKIVANLEFWKFQGTWNRSLFTWNLIKNLR